MSRGKGLVELRNLVEQQLHRPAVANDVVYRRHDHVFGPAQPQQPQAERRRLAQVEPF